MIVRKNSTGYSEFGDIFARTVDYWVCDYGEIKADALPPNMRAKFEELRHVKRRKDGGFDLRNGRTRELLMEFDSYMSARFHKKWA